MQSKYNSWCFSFDVKWVKLCVRKRALRIANGRKLAQTKINATSSENLPQVETKAHSSEVARNQMPTMF